MKTCIITGASRGIGKSLAITLKNKGYNVVGTYVNSQEIAKEITSEYGIDFHKCDVANDGDVCNLFSYVQARYGGVDLVISNAGIALSQKPFFDVALSDIEKVINVNLVGTMLVNKCAINAMLPRGGTIVNVSSIFGVTGGSCEAVYSASKSGVIGFTKSIAQELEDSKIKVCALTLGLIDTDMNSHLTESEKLEFVLECGLKSVPTAQDVADGVCEILQSGIKNGEIYSLFH